MAWDTEPALIVNGEIVTLGWVLGYAKFREELTLVDRACDAALIRQAAGERHLEVTPEELQQAADAFRRARGLHGVVQIQNWLAARSLSLEEWEAGLQADLLARKVRNAVAGRQVDRHFAQRILSYAGVELSQLLVGDEDLARELNVQLREEGADFHALARRHSRHEATRSAGGYRGLARRGELAASAQAAVFGASEGEVVGPFRTREGWWLYKVEKHRPAVLDEKLREHIGDELFEAWLSARRQEAEIRLPILLFESAEEQP